MKGTWFLAEKLLESIESSKSVWHERRISGEFDSKKDPHATKSEQVSRILVN